MMLLDDRKMRILQAVIDDYIDTAEPIGSRTIARKHELGLSSATIRNEMADLEEMGYLSQPHTSAGRVPSDKGYRFYVDKLMRVRQLSEEEINAIKSELEIKVNELSQLIRQASAVMSRFTKYTSMAVTPQMKKSTIKAVQVVPVLQGKALVIVVTDAGIVRNVMVKVSDNLSPENIIMISNIVDSKLRNHTLSEIDANLIKDIERNAGTLHNELSPILKGVIDCIEEIDNPEVYLEGATNIFEHPEFHDVDKAKQFLVMLAEKSTLCKLLSSDENSDVKIQIGSENNINELKDCTLITATYRVGDVTIGSFGIIGPTRMEYSKVISSMNHIRKLINSEISRLLREY